MVAIGGPMPDIALFLAQCTARGINIELDSNDGLRVESHHSIPQNIDNLINAHIDEILWVLKLKACPRQLRKEYDMIAQGVK